MVVVVFAVVFILGAVFAAELKPPEEQSSWFPEQHLYTKALNWQEDQFADASTDEVTTVTIVWGLKVRATNERHGLGSEDCALVERAGLVREEGMQRDAMFVGPFGNS